MKRHFSTLRAHSVGKSYDPGSSVRRREFRRNDAFQLKSESEVELHKINVEYRYEVKHAQSGSVGKVQLAAPSVEADKDDSIQSDTTSKGPAPNSSPCMSSPPFSTFSFLFHHPLVSRSFSIIILN